MKKYKNLATGDIEVVHSWDLSKKQLIRNHPEMFQELFEE